MRQSSLCARQAIAWAAIPPRTDAGRCETLAGPGGTEAGAVRAGRDRHPGRPCPLRRQQSPDGIRARAHARRLIKGLLKGLRWNPAIAPGRAFTISVSAARLSL